MQPQSAYHLAFHPSSDVENPTNLHGSTFGWGYQWGQTLAKPLIPLGVPDKDANEEIEACHRACALVQATSTPDPAQSWENGGGY